jgi:probable addiction module antidote protein
MIVVQQTEAFAIAMTMKLTRFDPADYLDDEDDMAAYFAECAEGGDPALMAQALGAIARARNLSQLARDTGMSRAGLSRALAPDGDPSFQTIAKIADALGLKISITPAKRPSALRPRPRRNPAAGRSA